MTPSVHHHVPQHVAGPGFATLAHPFVYRRGVGVLRELVGNFLVNSPPACPPSKVRPHFLQEGHPLYS